MKSALLRPAAMLVLFVLVPVVQGDDTPDMASEIGGAGFRTTVGEGDSQLPIVVVRGTPYQMGCASRKTDARRDTEVRSEGHRPSEAAPWRHE